MSFLNKDYDALIHFLMTERNPECPILSTKKTLGPTQMITDLYLYCQLLVNWLKITFTFRGATLWNSLPSLANIKQLLNFLKPSCRRSLCSAISSRLIFLVVTSFNRCTSESLGPVVQNTTTTISENFDRNSVELCVKNQRDVNKNLLNEIR